MAFRDEMAERLKGTEVKGATHPAIKRYLDGEAAPSIEFLEAAAQVLGVRKVWLVFGEGGMTEREQAVQEEVAAATEASVSEGRAPLSGRAYSLDSFREFEADVWRGLAIGSELLPDGPQPPAWWVAPFIQAQRGMGEGVDAVDLGRALRGPLEAVGMTAAAMEEEDWDDYIVGMIPVLLRLARARRPAPQTHHDEEE